MRPGGEYEGKRVVLTGVGRAGQVGEAVARAFAARGAMLALIGRDAQGVERAAATLRDAGGTVEGHACDLTDVPAVDALAARLTAGPGETASRVDALVNIAGGFGMSGPVAGSDVAMLQRMIAINIVTGFAATRAFLPALRRAAREGGHAGIVFFASAAVLPGGAVAGMSAYAIAKSGVITLMRAVAAEERLAGVRANALAPTEIRTAANLQAMGERASYVERESVADAVLFLCSDAARNVTGQVIELS